MSRSCGSDAGDTFPKIAWIVLTRRQMIVGVMCRWSPSVDDRAHGRQAGSEDAPDAVRRIQPPSTKEPRFYPNARRSGGG